MQEYIDALRTWMKKDYREMYREKGGIFPYEFLTPGSASYQDVLWDWNSCFSNVALKQILIDAGADRDEAIAYERGCILNYPSCWLGPVWGISNYLTFRGLLKYGYTDEARVLCEKTIRLFGRDVLRFGTMHEYYSPDDGKPVINPGFQNWNMLVLNMIYWYEGKEYIEEF